MNIKKLCTILVAMVMFTVVANAQTNKKVTKPNYTNSATKPTKSVKQPNKNVTKPNSTKNTTKPNNSAAQTNKNVTKFLGIPVDGYPYSMRQKLIAKGFKFIPGSDKDHPRSGGILTGIFNNEQVEIIIEKNPGTGKVYRINVQNQNEYSKDEAITKFNNLVTQFDAKANYTRTRREHSVNTYYIPDDVDDVDFDRNVDYGKYQANYYQEEDEQKVVWFMIWKYSGKYYIRIYYNNLYNEPKLGEYLCPR